MKINKGPSNSLSLDRKLLPTHTFMELNPGEVMRLSILPLWSFCIPIDTDKGGAKDLSFMLKFQLFPFLIVRALACAWWWCGGGGVSKLNA